MGKEQVHMAFWQNVGLDWSYSDVRMNEQKVPLWGLPECGEKGNIQKRKRRIYLRKQSTVRGRKKRFQKTLAGRRRSSVDGEEEGVR